MNKQTSTRFSEIRKFSKLWPYIKPYKLLNTFAILLVPAIALLQMILPMLIQILIDSGVRAQNTNLITNYAIFYLVAAIGLYAAKSGQTLISGLVVQKMVLNLRKKLGNHLLHLPARFHDKNLSGALATRATSDFDNLADSFNKGILNAGIDIISLIGSFTGMFLLDWRVAIIMIGLMPIIGIVITIFSRAMKKTLLIVRQKIGRLNGYTQESLSGSATIKVLGAEESCSKTYDHYNREYRNAQMKSVILDSLLFAVVDGFSSVAIGLLLWLLLTSIVPVPFLTAGLLIASVAYIKQIFEPLKQLSNKIAMLQGVFTAIDRIFGLLDISDSIEGDQQSNNLNGDVHFQKVSFHYNHNSEKILDNISFSLEAGKSLAIVGATGSGKTTIIKLLSKLYDGYKGKITIGDQNLSEIDGDQLREKIAFVPQDIALFDGSVSFNIGLDREELSEQCVRDAAQKIGATEFISKLPQGFDYQIKERGSNLSQGQRQLITFARALAKDPTIVILDEATASVDPESEEMIQQATETLFEGRTSIVIAHRLTTIRNCDSIIVIEKGKILEQGSHDDLMTQKGAYYQLQKGN